MQQDLTGLGNPIKYWQGEDSMSGQQQANSRALPAVWEHNDCRIVVWRHPAVQSRDRIYAPGSYVVDYAKYIRQRCISVQQLSQGTDAVGVTGLMLFMEVNLQAQNFRKAIGKQTVIEVSAEAPEEFWRMLWSGRQYLTINPPTSAPALGGDSAGGSAGGSKDAQTRAGGRLS
jgi:hypothetical protein